MKKKSNSLCCFQTSKKNRYFYDRDIKRTQLCHPLLYHLLKLKQGGINIEGWIKNLDYKSGFAEVENNGRYSKEDIDYYYQKYLILNENGYFSEFDQSEKLNARFNGEHFRQIMANMKQLTFEVTDRCNLNCEYCGYGKFYTGYDQRENKKMDIQYARTTIDYLVNFWNSPLNRSYDGNVYISFYGGEPLMNFSFIEEVVDYIKQLNTPRNNFSFSMTTNGILLDKYMDFLCENKFHTLISLDGNEQNNGYRIFKNGKSSFEIVYKNTVALQRKYPGYFSKYVNFNAVHHNKNSVSDIYHFFKTHFDKIPSIAGLNTSHLNETAKEEFWKTYSNINQSLNESEDYFLIEKEMFGRLPNTREAIMFLHHYTDFSFFDYNELMYSPGVKKRVPTATCQPFSKKFFVTVNGKILPCERIGHQFGLGQVTHEKVELDFDEIAERYNAYYDKMRKLCNVCSNAEICGQCIFNLDTIDSEKPVCYGFMDGKKFENYLASLVDCIEKDPGLYSKILKEVLIG